MKHLRPIRARMTTLLVAFLIPVALLALVLNAKLSETITFSTQEMLGVQYEKQLLGLLSKLADYQAIALRKEAGDDDIQSDMAAMATAIDTEMKALVVTDTEFGEALHEPTDHLTSTALLKQWQTLKTGDAYSTKAYAAIRRDILTMITHAGESSNLLRDSELGTRSLADSVTGAAPEMMHALAALNTRIYVLLNNNEGVVPESETRALAMDLALLKTAHVTRLQDGIARALRESRSFNATSPQLNYRLASGLEEFQMKHAVYQGMVGSVLSGEAIDPASYAANAKELNSSAEALVMAAVDSLDAMAQAKVANLRETRFSILATSSAVIAFVFVLFCMTSNSISQSVGHLSELADRFESELKPKLESLKSASVQLSGQAEHVSKLSAGQTNPATISTMADTAKTLSQLMASADKLTSGLNSLQTVSENPSDGIGTMVTSLRQVLDTLDMTSGRADDVTAFLTQVANQINLLSLNVAIEAARAGEAGKGFAGLAAELKTIAAQAHKASEGIGRQMQALQETAQEATRTIGALGSAAQKPEQGALARAVEQQLGVAKAMALAIGQAATGAGELQQQMRKQRASSDETGEAAKQVVALATKLSGETMVLETQLESFLSEVRNA